uniref:Rieske domain-containing protein n=1 Tax=Leersia perrieri TaxID=77586 RepID=A0A0D9VM21_9ORYZ
MKRALSTKQIAQISDPHTHMTTPPAAAASAATSRPFSIHLLHLPVSSSSSFSSAASATHPPRVVHGGVRWRRRRGRRCRAAVVEEAADGVLLPKEGEGDDLVKEEGRYDWRQEWYPLYLTKEVPDDAALPVTVFDRQLVLYRDGDGVLRCHEDRCPHRLAKLSEGQLVDGKLECLYHGWQFDGQGKCVKIPQLPEGAKIPRNACAVNYEVVDSQGVVWVWMSPTTPPPDSRKQPPWFEPYARTGFTDLSTIHELPYDHSILLENLMDPAHVPISHDRTDWTAKREDAQPLFFELTERTARGFAGYWGKQKKPELRNFVRFEAPCVLTNTLEFVDKDGKEQCFSAHFLCRPAGQGKSVLLVRFGSTARSPLMKVIPEWFFHQNACKVFEQDMGFLSSQNEVLVREKLPTKELYLNLRSSDTWVAEYRRWMDRVGDGMPYYFGHSSISPPVVPAVVEQAPAGGVAGISAAFPAKGGVGGAHAPNPTNRYFRHVVHCKGCRETVKGYTATRNLFAAAAAAAVAAAILAATRRWKAVLLAAAAGLAAASYGCSWVITLITTNFIRTHRRL